MKYAWCHDMRGEHWKWSLTPWRLRGLREFECVANVPDDYVLISSHVPPWASPLREYIAEGRPWIEIEYGYWGPDTPRRETRRVTYCGHHNLQIKPVSCSRSHLFPQPQIQPWRETPGEYLLGIEPVEVVLQQRTGENMEQFHARIENAVRPYWNGPIRWRRKVGAKHPRFQTFTEQLKLAHAVIGERTMACVESCLLGVPGYTVDVSMSSLLMGGVENLAASARPDRQAWWEHICWSQFNRAEFDTTTPADLVEEYQISGH